MTQYYGDFLEDDTVYIPFNTFSSDDPSASVTITNLADADIKVHKDGSATQIVTDGATVSIDFDSITGNHLVTIDTSVHADYATGSDYLVRMEGTTVDGATINAWIGSFSIENRTSSAALRPTTSGRTLDVTAGGTAGIDWGNIENKTTANDLSGTDIQLVDTCTTNTDMITTAAVNAEVDTALTDIGLDHLLSASVTGTDVTDDSVVAQLVSKSATADWDDYDNTDDSLQAIRDRGDAEWTTGGGGSSPVLLQNTTIATLSSQTSFTLTAGSADDDAYNDMLIVVTDQSTSTQKAVGRISDYTGSTKTITLKSDPAVFTMATGDTVDVIAVPDRISLVDTTTTNTDMRGTDSAYTGTPPTAVAIRTEMDSNSTQLAAIVADTGEIGTAGAGLTDLGGMSTAMKAEVNAECDTAISDAALATAASLATVDTNVDAILVDTGTTIPGTIATVDANVDTMVSGIITGAAQTGTLSTTQATTDLTGYADDQLIGRVIIWTSGDCDGEATDITDYASASGLLTFTALTTAPGNTDTFKIV